MTPSSTAGPTFVSGTLTANTTWTIPGSPYIVNGDVTVPAGVTLTLEPGTKVRFDATSSVHSIFVFGTILSVGQPDALVSFTSADSPPDRGDWGSIRLDGSNTSVFEWTEFAWAATALDVWQCSPRIANNTILETLGSAIRVIGPNAAPIIENNTIRSVLFDQRIGIFMQDADAIVRNNALRENYFGIYVFRGGRPRVENNTIRDGWQGVLVVNADPFIANNTIEGNGLPNIGGVGILLSFASATLRDNTIRNNGVGVRIPYDSKETLSLSHGNVVNGIPLEALYRYRSRDPIDGLNLDSGRASGFTGNATEQGLLTFYDCVNVTVRHAQLRNNDALIFAANSSVLVENSTLTNSSNAFSLTSFSQVVSLNNEFAINAVNFTDQRSALTIKNFVHVRTLSETSNPIKGSIVRVRQDGIEISRGITDVDGWSRWNVATYGVLARLEQTAGPPSLSRPLVEVAVDHSGFVFRGTPRVVNMSQTHTPSSCRSSASSRSSTRFPRTTRRGSGSARASQSGSRNR